MSFIDRAERPSTSGVLLSASHSPVFRASPLALDPLDRPTHLTASRGAVQQRTDYPVAMAGLLVAAVFQGTIKLHDVVQDRRSPLLPVPPSSLGPSTHITGQSLLHKHVLDLRDRHRNRNCDVSAASPSCGPHPDAETLTLGPLPCRARPQADAANLAGEATDARGEGAGTQALQGQGRDLLLGRRCAHIARRAQSSRRVALGDGTARPGIRLVSIATRQEGRLRPRHPEQNVRRSLGLFSAVLIASGGDGNCS